MLKLHSRLLALNAGLLIVVAFAVVIFAGITGAWNPLASIFPIAGAYAAVYVSIMLLAIGAALAIKPLPWLTAIVVGCAVVAVGHFIGNTLAQTRRESEVRQALDAGLERDCQKLFASHREELKTARDGFIRVFPNSPEFDALPRSIRMLNPCYVTIEDRAFGDASSNVGICTCGFGGFAFGVRIFMGKGEIPEPFWSKELAPNVYLWQEET